MESLPPRIGPYRVVGKLGQGGMGVVYLVQDPDTPRQLALKLIRDSGASELAVERFWREAEVLARLHHRSVLRVHQVGQVPEGTYLVMERVEGRPLDEVLREDGPVAPREAARIVRELADAVEAVHAAGVLHRDIKPGNVILKPEGIPVLLDFGLVRDASQARLTKTGTTLGTLAYMSPEQAGGESTTGLGPPTDTYSLGVVLYELLTGRRPFDEEHATVLIGQKLYETAPSIRTFLPDAPRGLETICQVALARAPTDRYATAAELREDLDRFLAGRPPLASARGRGARRLAASLGAVLLILILSLVGVWATRESALTEADPAALERAAGEVGAAARTLLGEAGLLAPRAAAVTALSERLAELDAQHSPEAEAGPKLARARARVAALRGLIDVASDELDAARAALAQANAGGRDRPGALALGGAIGAVTTASDPAAAARDLGRALQRGARVGELRGWRARTLTRAGLGANQAEVVLDDLKRLERLRRLDDVELGCRAQALATLKRSQEARRVLKTLRREPSLTLRWAVALSEAEHALEEDDPGGALARLAELPEQMTPSPARARIAALVRARVLPLERTIRDRSDRELELRLLAYAELLRRLEPLRPLRLPLLQVLVDACTRWRNSKYWSPGDADRLSKILPPRADLHAPLAAMGLQLRTASERRRLLPVLERAVAVMRPGPERLNLRVARCVSLAQTGQAEQALRRAELLIGPTEGQTALRIDVLAARAMARLQQGKLVEALNDVDEALTLGTIGKWTGGGLRYHRARVLIAMQRIEEAAREIATYLERAPPMAVEADVEKDSWRLAWRYGRESNPPALRRAYARALKHGPTPTKRRLRLVALLLKAGEVEAAQEQLERVLPRLQGGKHEQRTLAKLAQEALEAVKARGAKGSKELAALVESLGN